MELVPGLDNDASAAVNHKLVVYSPLGRLNLIISDPEMVEDLFTTKNKLIDKSGDIDRQAKPLLGDTFLFSKTDQNWKLKRQSCAHAFYKDRMENLMSVLKDIMEKHMISWYD